MGMPKRNETHQFATSLLRKVDRPAAIPPPLVPWPRYLSASTAERWSHTLDVLRCTAAAAGVEAEAEAFQGLHMTWKIHVPL
jgi:hypothetical protein